MDVQWRTMRPSLPGRKALLGGSVVVIIGGLLAGALILATPGTVASSDDTQIRNQVTSYFNLYLQLDVVTPDAKTGRVPASVLSVLDQHAVKLTTVLTGDILTSHTQAVKRYKAELQNNGPVDVYTAGAVDSIAFDSPALVTGSSAVISGRYAYRFESYHLENAVRVPDGLRGTNSFTAQLQRTNGVWLIASIQVDQLDVQANYSLPPGQGAQSLPSGPLPTKLPPPSVPIKQLP